MVEVLQTLPEVLWAYFSTTSKLELEQTIIKLKM